MVGNVVVDTAMWLQGCRFADGWIGHMNQSNNFIACDKTPPGLTRLSGLAWLWLAWRWREIEFWG